MKTRENLTDRERQLVEVSVHEASHAVCGVVLGGRLRACTVTGGLAAGTISGRTTFDVFPAGHEPQVAYAGPFAQLRWRHDRSPTQRELYALLDGGSCGDAAVLTAAGGIYLGAAVTGLVEKCWKPVIEVTRLLARHAVVRHADVARALGLSADGPTAALQLSLIRSGSRPGGFRVTAPVSA